MKNIAGFFMGANSKDGFVSLFEGLARENGGRRLFVIKSGPGCGKSTLMRTLSQRFKGDNQHILCASDPDSLDAVIFPDINAAVIDGTAPHVLEPELPGAAGGYITLPQFLNAPLLRQKLPELRELSARAKEHYAQSSRLIYAAARLDENVRARLSPHISEEKLRARARGIASRELGKKRGGGEQVFRFLDGITPRGVLRLYSTVDAMAKKVYAITDSYGLAAPLLDEIRTCALECGHTVYTCLCPVDTKRVLHVLVPSLGLAFVTSDPLAEYDGEVYRHIRADAYIPPSVLRAERGKLRLMQRISRSLLDDAADEVNSAHLLHSEIEAIYRPHIDVSALEQMPEALESILHGA